MRRIRFLAIITLATGLICKQENGRKDYNQKQNTSAGDIKALMISIRSKYYFLRKRANHGHGFIHILLVPVSLLRFI